MYVKMIFPLLVTITAGYIVKEYNVVSKYVYILYRDWVLLHIDVFLLELRLISFPFLSV